MTEQQMRTSVETITGSTHASRWEDATDADVAYMRNAVNTIGQLSELVLWVDETRMGNPAAPPR